MDGQTGWLFIAVIVVLMAVFAVSVFLNARKQADPEFFADEDQQ